MYRRVTDATGRVEVVEYDIVRREKKDAAGSTDIDTSKFALREDVERLKSELDMYKNRMGVPMDVGRSRMDGRYEEE